VSENNRMCMMCPCVGDVFRAYDLKGMLWPLTYCHYLHETLLNSIIAPFCPHKLSFSILRLGLTGWLFAHKNPTLYINHLGSSLCFLGDRGFSIFSPCEAQAYKPSC